MTTQAAKKLVKAFLDEHELPYDKLTAKTISFEGFGFGKKLFVKVHGWRPNPQWENLRAVASQHGFLVEAQDVYAGDAR